MVVFICLIVIVLQAVAAYQFNEIAKIKGFDEGYFWWCLIFGFAGWIMVAALPDRKGSTAVSASLPASSELPDL